jgi:outer membrane murein-binding lipoprotein Lpp
LAESSDRKVNSQRVSTAPLTECAGCVTLAPKVQELENDIKELKADVQELKAENKELKADMSKS